MIASPFFSNHSNPLIKKASRNIIHKITFLQQGNKAPKICLSDLTGIRHCSNNRSDKFKYIVFADVETVVCKEHLKYLGRINELFHKHLEIFVVLRETKKDDMVKFFAENETAGINMIDIGNNYIEKYKVRSFPGCYLLDEEHKVQFAHTKAPLDGFEQQFGTFLRNELFMRQREQYQNKN